MSQKCIKTYSLNIKNSRGYEFYLRENLLYSERNQVGLSLEQPISLRDKCNFQPNLADDEIDEATGNDDALFHGFACHFLLHVGKNGPHCPSQKWEREKRAKRLNCAQLLFQGKAFWNKKQGKNNVKF